MPLTGTVFWSTVSEPSPPPPPPGVVNEPVSVTPLEAAKPFNSTKYVPAVGAAIAQSSVVVGPSLAQLLSVVVGWLPSLAYTSVSPGPPVVLKCRLVAPAGTSSLKNNCCPVARLMPETGAPFCSAVSPPLLPPAVNVAVSVMPLEAAKPFNRTKYVPACGAAMTQLSDVVGPSLLQSLTVVVGWLPSL